MLKERKKSFETLFQLSDILILLFSFGFAFYLRFDLQSLLSDEFRLQFKVFFLSYAILWLFFSSKFNLYHSKRFTAFWNEIFGIIKTGSLCFIIAAILSFFFASRTFKQIIYFIFWGHSNVCVNCFSINCSQLFKIYSPQRL